MTNSPRFIQVQNAESADRQLSLHRKQALSTAILESHGCATWRTSACTSSWMVRRTTFTRPDPPGDFVQISRI